MGLYFGGFGVGRNGVRFRPYGGVYTPILRGMGAAGLSAKGTPWVKINGKRALRRLARQQQRRVVQRPSMADRWAFRFAVFFGLWLAVAIGMMLAR